MDCASLCKTPLYYIARDVKDGPPTQDCVIPIMKELDQPIFGAASLITGLLCLAACVGTIPLCTGFVQGKDMMEED